MPPKRTLRLAPWVIWQNDFLLGPKLNTIRVPHLSIPTIPHDKLTELIKNDYIVKQANQKIIQTPFQPLERLDKQINWVWVPDRSCLETALLLKESLSKLNFPYHWEIALNKKTIVKNLATINNKLEKPFIIRLSHKESIEKKIAINFYADLIDKAKIIWIGETTEGTHLGPVIQTLDDVENYLFATKSWYFSKKLIELGFKEYWPLFIHKLIRINPEQVARAIFQVTKAPQKTCILIEENREVCLWTKLLNKKNSESNFFKTQFWSKGLIRNFYLNQFDFTNEAYLAKCRTPCNGIDYLEGNSGKGVTSGDALYSLVGEAVERFSAWQSNKNIAKSNSIKKIENDIVYNIDQFHPFGPKWNDYLASSKVALPLYKVKNELDPNSIHFVPECLIPFPYEATESQFDVTTSSTAGLATHNSYKKALIKGTLELFERDDFYNSFLSQKAGFNIDFSRISLQPKSLNSFSHNLICLLNCLKANQLHYWCFVYNLRSTLPIVYSFIFDRKNNFFSRGAGSGYSLLEAASGAIVEALQIRQQFLKNDDSQSAQGYRDWRTPTVIEQIHHYLESFQVLPFFDHPLRATQYTPTLLLNELKENIRMFQKPLLVANLPCPIREWTTVRVLIPGFTTHQHSSESLGGSKISNPVFKYGIPT